MFFKTLTRGMALAVLLTAAVTSRGMAQTATPEGTVITNTAVANYTDANSNTYAPDSASVSLTVGFASGVDVKSPATLTPASPSTGNVLPFTVVNTSNGRDSVSMTFSPAAGITITGYTFNANNYSTLAGLDSALAQAGIAAGDSIIVDVVYTVASGKGGQTMPVSGTATSLRVGSTDDTSSTDIEPPGESAVDVTTTPADVERLPSNGTQYSQTFSVANNGNTGDTYTLTSSDDGATITIISVNGTPGNGSTVTVAADGSEDVVVVYTVGDVAAGTTGTVGLLAVSQADTTKSDAASATVTVIRPSIQIAKAAFMDDSVTAIHPDSTVAPGQYVMYKITVTNSGSASADSVVVTDVIPSDLTYDSSAGGTGSWTIGEVSGTVTATLGGSLAETESRFFWIRVRVK